ncbi:hypothetical protein EVAR_95232_1 [Eumeta japonica]|uniref:Uncharacterized protein n=1 Tax=Eumeta variegata TaxID=151549 RepID=A0A4C1UJV8_EUMVA|nr:hypothetical protein EVAR_95232_1 [Eumeta japonica]
MIFATLEWSPVRCRPLQYEKWDGEGWSVMERERESGPLELSLTGRNSITETVTSRIAVSRCALTKWHAICFSNGNARGHLSAYFYIFAYDNNRECAVLTPNKAGERRISIDGDPRTAYNVYCEGRRTCLKPHIPSDIEINYEPFMWSSYSRYPQYEHLLSENVGSPIGLICAKQRKMANKRQAQWATELHDFATHCTFSNLEESPLNRFVMGMLPGHKRDEMFKYIQCRKI